MKSTDSFFLFSVCFTGSILLFIPKILGLNLVNGDGVRHDMPIYNSIKSQTFHDSIVCSICLSIPAILDLVMDLDLRNASKWNVEILSRVLILVGMVLPSVLTLAVAIPSDSPELVVELIRFRGFMLFISTSIITFTEFNSWHYTMRTTTVFMAVGFVLLNLRSYFTNQLLVLTSLFFLVGGAVLFTVLSVVISRKIWISLRINGSLTPSEYVCLLYHISAIMAIIGFALEAFIYGPVLRGQSSGFQLALSSYLLCPIIVTTTIFQGRIYRKEKVKYQVQRYFHINR